MLHRPTPQINSFLQKANLFQSRLINLALKMVRTIRSYVSVLVFYHVFFLDWVYKNYGAYYKT